jgi:hypothetical protein
MDGLVVLHVKNDTKDDCPVLCSIPGLNLILKSRRRGGMMKELETITITTSYATSK